MSTYTRYGTCPTCGGVAIEEVDCDLDGKVKGIACKFKPKFIAYHNDGFATSIRVNRRLTWQQRHIYKMLCLEAAFCDTRPYLPTDDTELATLADVPDEVWTANRDAVLKMFTPCTIDGVEFLSHPRITEEYEKSVAGYERMRKLSQAGNNSRHGSQTPPAREPHESTAGVRNETLELRTEILDKEQRQQVIVNDAGIDNDCRADASLNSKTTEPPTTTRVSVEEAQLLTANVITLTNTLHKILSLRPEVKIHSKYDSLWGKDWKQALERYSFEEVLAAVKFSQLPRNQKYFVRSAGIVQRLDSLVEQCQDPANVKALDLLWKSALLGKLPTAKEVKEPPVGGYRGVKPRHIVPQPNTYPHECFNCDDESCDDCKAQKKQFGVTSLQDRLDEPEGKGRGLRCAHGVKTTEICDECEDEEYERQEDLG